MLTVVQLEPRVEEPERPLPDPRRVQEWLQDAGVPCAHWLVDGRVMAPVALRDALFGPDGGSGAAGPCGDHVIARLEPGAAGLGLLRRLLAADPEAQASSSGDGSAVAPVEVLLVDGARWRPFDLASLLAAHRAGVAPLTVAVEAAEIGGCVDMDRTGRITRLLAPLLRDPLAAWRPAGAAVLDAQLILPGKLSKDGRDPFGGAPAAVHRSIWAGLLPDLVRRGNVVVGHPVEREVPVTA